MVTITIYQDFYHKYIIIWVNPISTSIIIFFISLIVISNYLLQKLSNTKSRIKVEIKIQKHIEIEIEIQSHREYANK